MEQCPLLRGNNCETGDRISGRTKQCHLITGDTCEEWESIQKEWREEND